MRRLLGGFLALALVPALAGCGEDEAGKGPLEQALAYMPRDGAVIAIPTDLDGEQLQAFEEKLGTRLFGGSVEKELAEGLEDETDLSFEDDVKPQLGNDAVIGLDPRRVADEQGPFTVMALEVRDGERLRDLLDDTRLVAPAGSASGADLYRSEGSKEPDVALEGDLLVVAQRERDLRDALARRDADEGDAARRFADALGDLPDDGFLRAAGDARPALELPELRRLARIPWFSAVRTLALSARFEGDELQLDARVGTDPAELSEDELPLAPGLETPGVVSREDQIVGGSANQSQTTAFLLRMAREAFPDSRFVRDVAKVERALGIDFEREVLRQFDGPSASALELDGRFAARSEVSDPRGLARVMRRLAPDLGRLVADLEALESEGLALLFLFAPDAPVSQGVLGASRIEVETVPGERDFYRISGLSGEGPDEIFFGLERGVFVIGSDERRAKAIAREPAEPPEGVDGASVTRANLARLAPELEQRLGSAPPPLGELTGSLSATTEALRGSLRIELP